MATVRVVWAAVDEEVDGDAAQSVGDDTRRGAWNPSLS